MPNFPSVQTVINESPQAAHADVTVTTGLVMFNTWNGSISQYNNIYGPGQMLWSNYAAGTAGAYNFTFPSSWTPVAGQALTLVITPSTNSDQRPWTGAQQYNPAETYVYYTVTGDTYITVATAFYNIVKNAGSAYYTVTNPSSGVVLFTSNNSLYPSTGVLYGNAIYTFGVTTAQVPASGTSSQVSKFNPAAVPGHNYDTFLIRYPSSVSTTNTNYFGTGLGTLENWFYYFIQAGQTNTAALEAYLKTLFPNTQVFNLPVAP